MVNVDTNVLIRLIVSDDAAQQLAAERRLAKELAGGGTVLVTSVVLAEVAWVLDAAYAFPRARIAEALRRLVDTPPLWAKDRDAVVHAIAAYSSGSADFSDYLIRALGDEAGAASVITFDRRLAREPGCERP